MKVLINGQEQDITIHHQDGERVSFTLDSVTYHYRRKNTGERPFTIALEQEQNNHLVTWHQERGVVEGWDVIVCEVLPTPTRSHKPTSTGEDELRSPMPGKILQIKVKKGDAVKAGEVLAVMEAMKMEHTIKAPRAGIVSQVPWSPGDRVEGGVVLVELEEKA